MKRTPGVYFLKSKGNVVYVGKSINVHKRIWDHTDKEYDDYSFVECPESELDKLERKYIDELKPIYNRTISVRETQVLTAFSVRLPPAQKAALERWLWEKKGEKLAAGVRRLLTEIMIRDGIRW